MKKITRYRKIVERCTINTPPCNMRIHDRALSWIGIGTSIKSGGRKLVVWAQGRFISGNIDSLVILMIINSKLQFHSFQ